MIMAKFGQYFGQIWPCLGQNLSKLIFHQTFGLMGVDLKFQIFLTFFENLVNLAKIWKKLLEKANFFQISAIFTKFSKKNVKEN